MFRKRALASLCGFNASMFGNAEYDLVLRALRCGLKCVYTEDILVQVPKQDGNLSNDRALARKGEKQALMGFSDEELKALLEDPVDLAQVLIRREDYANALVVLSGNWPSFRAQFLLGVLYFKTRDFLQAQRCFQRALHFRPNSPEALNNLGASIASLGDPLKGREYLRKALAILEDYRDAKNEFTLTEAPLR